MAADQAAGGRLGFLSRLGRYGERPSASRQRLKSAFPPAIISGDIWSGSEEGRRCGQRALPAKGYLALISVFPSGTDFKVGQTLKKDVIDAGKGDLKDQSKFGSVYYNAGPSEPRSFTLRRCGPATRSSATIP